jgi:hypothetical protein
MNIAEIWAETSGLQVWVGHLNELGKYIPGTGDGGVDNIEVFRLPTTTYWRCRSWGVRAPCIVG